MEAQVVTIDQPFNCADEKFMEITSHLSAEMSCDQTHSEIEAYLETDGANCYGCYCKIIWITRAPVVLKKRCVARMVWCARTSAITWEPAIKVCLVAFGWRARAIAIAG